MAVDLYLRIPSDPNYSELEIEVDDSLQLFLQEIEMILTTRKGDVLGDPDFGANLEDFVWSTYSSIEIQNRIHQQISKYCYELSNKIPYSVNVQFVQGEIYDSILVDVEIDGTTMIGIMVNP
jgi:hypothetical protein